jgi:uncharacterized membrane protein
MSIRHSTVQSAGYSVYANARNTVLKFSNHLHLPLLVSCCFTVFIVVLSTTEFKRVEYDPRQNYLTRLTLSNLVSERKM